VCVCVCVCVSRSNSMLFDVSHTHCPVICRTASCEPDFLCHIAHAPSTQRTPRLRIAALLILVCTVSCCERFLVTVEGYEQKRLFSCYNHFSFLHITRPLKRVTKFRTHGKRCMWEFIISETPCIISSTYSCPIEVYISIFYKPS
jgi:hypothetical protein